jgi:hypothetical protein
MSVSYETFISVFFHRTDLFVKIKSNMLNWQIPSTLVYDVLSESSQTVTVVTAQ